MNNNLTKKVKLKMIKESKGITVIALVVTIVILIIIASISVNAILKSGMLDRTIDARGEFENNQSTVKREISELLDDTRNPFQYDNESDLGVSVINTTEPYQDDMYSINQELNYEITVTNTGKEVEKNLRLKSVITDYDGNEKNPYELGNENTEYTNDGYIDIAELAPGESIKFTTKWKTEDGGKIINTAKVLDTSEDIIKATDRAETIVTAGYNGVTIGEVEDVIFDGKEHKLKPEVKDKNGNKLIEGKDYLISYGSDDFVNVGIVDITITGLSPYYSIDPESPEDWGAGGELTMFYNIMPRPITIQGGSASKIADGLPLICNDYIIVEGELVEGDEMRVTCSSNSGKYINIGTYSNAIIDIEFLKGKESNYVITTIPGEIEIKPKTIS